ncbi:MAG: phosphate-starvation-inducible PsiE family protein [Nitrospira defluvii]|nr:phosphate-starvation-inducible PsiE family protein [Nitrospira defluvii]
MMQPPTSLGSKDKSRRVSMQWWLGFMDQLDRLGYVAAGFSLLALGMIIFVHAWYVFLSRPVQLALLPAGLKLLNDLLLVIILLELFRTVVRFLQTEVLELEPYLAVGIIACTRRVLTASAELSYQLEMVTRETRQELFQQYLMDVGLNVTVIIILILGVYLLRKRPTPV